MRWYSPRDWVEGEGGEREGEGEREEEREGEGEGDQVTVNANTDPSLCREERPSKFNVLSEPEGGGEGDGWEGEGWGGGWDVIGEDDSEREEEEKVVETEAEPAKKVDNILHVFTYTILFYVSTVCGW